MAYGFGENLEILEVLEVLEIQQKGKIYEKIANLFVIDCWGGAWRCTYPIGQCGLRRKRQKLEYP